MKEKYRHTYVPSSSLPDTLAPPHVLQETSSQCARCPTMSYYFPNKCQVFSLLFFLFLWFWGFFIKSISSHNIAIDPQVWWQATKWISNIRGASEVPEPNCRLETHSWLLHQQKRSLMCNSTHHPS